MRDVERALAGFVGGAFFLAFAWLYHFTGILPMRWHGAITAESDPDRFTASLVLIVVLAVVSFAIGVVSLLRR